MLVFIKKHQLAKSQILEFSLKWETDNKTQKIIAFAKLFSF